MWRKVPIRFTFHSCKILYNLDLSKLQAKEGHVLTFGPHVEYGNIYGILFTNIHNYMLLCYLYGE